ncbi:transposase [Streptomyces sp. NRRL F-2664]|uniref:transposase n=1 Tax=Streptomyces sp. NRRL F-2664 TaxID=1463842 RepID=UPI003B63778B
MDTVADTPGEQSPKAKEMLPAANDDLTAFAALPLQHWKKIQSANPLKPLNREIKRRTPRRVARLPPPLPAPKALFSRSCHEVTGNVV